MTRAVRRPVGSAVLFRAWILYAPVLFVHGAFAADNLAGFDCLIEPHSIIDVSTREEGILEALLVDRGDLIQRGQALAELDSVIERASVELARARADMAAVIAEREVSSEFAKRQALRSKELYDKNALPFHEVDKSDTEVQLTALRLQQARHEQQVGQLELARAEQLLSLRTIRSPIKGVVVERLLYPGESVKDQSILRIARIDPLNVEIIVPVSLFGKIAPGMKAQVTPVVPGGRVHQATVTVVDRVVDAASGTFGVRLELPNPDYKLPGGLKCDIRFAAK
jgi:RND family efflux transporter MFP subunit